MSVATTAVWRNLLRDLLASPLIVAPESPGAEFRGRTSKELLAHRTVVPMENAVVACPGRKMGYRFLAAEAAWILTGDNRLVTIAPYAKHMVRFSDDGRTLGGAYGPPFVEQIGWVTQTLARDAATRQAVMTIWRPRPGASADTPCTVALQWLIRDDRLHCVATMRSSDAWTGWVYDIHTFSMMSAFILIAGRPRISATLGNLYLTAGSQHLYKLDWEPAEACAARTDALFDARPIKLEHFNDPDELVNHLWSVAGRQDSPKFGAYLSGLTQAISILPTAS